MPTSASTTHPRKPPTFSEALLADEDSRHRTRLQEIKAMGALLALLDRFAPALEERGIQLRTWGAKHIQREQRHRALFIQGTDRYGAFRQLHATLLELGFKEVDRTDYPSWAYTVLAHGRLRVSMHVDKAAPSTGRAS